MTDLELMELAEKARLGAYAPYSNFYVGAALLASDGTVFTGANVENAAFTPTSCAERTALFQAVAKGYTSFEKIAVVGGLGDELSPLCAPCGVCRQALAEFCDPDFPVILGNTKDGLQVYTLEELLPFAFTSKDVLQ